MEPISLFSVLGNHLDLWSFGRNFAIALVSVRIGKDRKILRLYYLYIDLFRVRYNCFLKRQRPSMPLNFKARVCAINCKIAG